MGNKERIQELKDEIRRLEAEETASVFPRMDALRELVTRTGYFRAGRWFYKAAADPKVACDDDGLMFSVDIELCVSPYAGNGNANVSCDADDTMETFDPEDVVPITEADFIAARALYDSVRSQVSSFINQYCNDDE